MISPFDAWAIQRALAGRDLDETLAGVSRALRPLVEYLGSLTRPELRASPWQGFVRGRGDRDELARDVDRADPGGSPPTVEAGTGMLRILAAAVEVKKAGTFWTINILDFLTAERANVLSVVREDPCAGSRGQERANLLDDQHS